MPYGVAGVEPVPEEALPPDETLRFAARLLREGRPFAAHEVLEASWKACPEVERDFWQGLAQLCVGLTHAARGNGVGGARLLQRGAGRIADALASGASSHGVDVHSLLVWADNAALRDSLSTELAESAPWADHFAALADRLTR